MEAINTKSDCAKFIVSLAEAFGQEWTAARTESYLFTYLEELQAADLQDLKRAIMRGCEWMPKPKEFGEMVRRIGPCKKALAINDVNWVLTNCERHGEDFYENVDSWMAYVKDTLMKAKLSDCQNRSIINQKFWDWVSTVQRYRENFNEWNKSQLPPWQPKETLKLTKKQKPKFVPIQGGKLE